MRVLGVQMRFFERYQNCCEWRTQSVFRPPYRRPLRRSPSTKCRCSRRNAWSFLISLLDGRTNDGTSGVRSAVHKPAVQTSGAAQKLGVGVGGHGRGGKGGVLISCADSQKVTCAKMDGVGTPGGACALLVAREGGGWRWLRRSAARRCVSGRNLRKPDLCQR